MRLLAIALIVSLAASPVVAADKDEDKAKEVTTAFLKAVKAKDLDAVMKTVDVPFMLDVRPGGKGEPILKADELKEQLKTFLEKVQPEKVPSEVGTVLDAPALRKKLEEKKVDEKALEQLEKFLGKTGYAVMMKKDDKEVGAILVQVKDGKAKVVGIPK